MEAQPKAQNSTDISSEQIAALRAAFRGPILEPGDPEYEVARRVYNGMIDKRPRLIARCADEADAIASVNLARETGLLVSVRGGGHGVAGFSVCDDGLVIDLSGMKGIRIDPDKGTVRVGGGCVWAEVDHATHAFGFAVPSGIVSTTGVAGLTLGGGHGYLTRAYGLTCDNLVSADVVTAGGELVSASEERNQDLFWGLRGGGGNFGVVTSFEFKLRPVHTVVGGPIFFRGHRSREAMRAFREIMLDAPDELYAFFGLHIEPPEPFIPGDDPEEPIALMVVCYTGPMEDAENAVRPFRALSPDADMIGPMPFTRLQKLFDHALPHGLQHYWKGDFYNDLSDEMIEIYLDHGSRVPTFRTAVHLYPIDGAAHRVREDESAFSYRDAKYSGVIAAIYDEPERKPEMVDWVRSFWSAAHPHSAGAAYVNFLMEEGQDRVRAAYRGNYDRLLSLKNKYDPNNLFRMNQNIRPT